jgi:hypothetical protein
VTAAAPVSDHASRPAVEACVFRTGTALSISFCLPLAGFELQVLTLRTLIA